MNRIYHNHEKGEVKYSVVNRELITDVYWNESNKKVHVHIADSGGWGIPANNEADAVVIIEKIMESKEKDWVDFDAD